MMKKNLDRAIALAGIVRRLFVSTANAKGVPHLCIAERLTLEGENIVGVTSWFCPQTAENVNENASVSIAVWDEQPDTGFQLIGEVTHVLDLAMLNGYMEGETETVPNIERKLVVRVDQILTFSYAHHSDIIPA